MSKVTNLMPTSEPSDLMLITDSDLTVLLVVSKPGREDTSLPAT